MQNTMWDDITRNFNGIIGVDLCRVYNAIKVIIISH